jgi:sec-independent protein translocase protein TatB
MEILGIGASEFLFIVIIAIIVLGPKDMQKAGKTIGRWLNRLIHSDGWKVFQKTSAEIRNLPTNLMREANLDMRATEKDIRKAMDFKLNAPASTPSRQPSPLNETGNSIEPPTVKSPEPDPDQHD